MNKKELQHIIGYPITSIQEISGGDISLAQRVSSAKGIFFVKSASFINAKAIFNNEVIGLNELRKSKAIEIPKVVDTFSVNKRHGLILEYIKSETRRRS